MIESSPYEGQFDSLNGKTCLGRVTAVDADSRTVRVKTLGDKTAGTDDQDLQNVKMLHLAWHPEGDYALFLPRVGTYVVVLFINSEPYMVGVYPLSNTFGAGGRTNQEALLPGDFGMMTVAGNSLIVRSGGTIEISSTKGCRTYWLPSDETITSVCQNFELEPAGGRLHWTVDPKSSATTMEWLMWDNADTPTAGVKVQAGTTDAGPVFDMKVGPLDANLDVTSPTCEVSIAVDGTTTVNVGPGKVTMTLAPDGSFTVQTSGAVNVNCGADANVTASGNVNVKGAKIILNSAGSGVTTANSHMNVIDLITGKPVQPSTTVFADV